MNALFLINANSEGKYPAGKYDDLSSLGGVNPFFEDLIPICNHPPVITFLYSANVLHAKLILRNMGNSLHTKDVTQWPILRRGG